MIDWLEGLLGCAIVAAAAILMAGVALKFALVIFRWAVAR